MDRLTEIERNWDPEARHDAGFLTMDQIAWLIGEVKRLRLREETLAAVVKKQGLHIKRLVEGDQRTSDEDLRQRPTD